MAKIINQRMAAQMDGEFVVFLIGMRINKPWKIHQMVACVHRDAQDD
jgi:hypothetical protein